MTMVRDSSSETTRYPSLAARIKGTPRPLEEHWLDSTASRGLIMTIAPDVADSILVDRNPRNRIIKQNLISRLTQALQCGRWAVNGETIIFDWDGNLCDGQHRLRACVITGIPLMTWVVFGVDPNCFPTIDRGGARTNGDVLGMMGEKNRDLLAAAVAMLWRDMQGKLTHFNLNPSPEESAATLDVHPGLRDAVNYIKARKASHNAMPPRVAAFCLYRFSRIEEGAALKFFEDFSTGAIGDAKDPVLQLRNQLIESKSSRRKLTPTAVLALTIKAWNYRREGKTVRALRWVFDGPTPEPFPTIR